MRATIAFLSGAIVASAFAFARSSPAAPAVRWEYKVLDVDAQGRTRTNVPIDGETDMGRAKRIATDPLLVTLATAEREGWDLVSVVQESDSCLYTYFLRRAMP